MGATITIKQASSELDSILDNYEWYLGNEIEGRKITVFVERQDKEVSDLVPDVLYGHQITLAFEAYKNCGKKYGAIHLEFPSRMMENLIID